MGPYHKPSTELKKQEALPLLEGKWAKSETWYVDPQRDGLSRQAKPSLIILTQGLGCDLPYRSGGLFLSGELEP